MIEMGIEQEQGRILLGPHNTRDIPKGVDGGLHPEILQLFFYKFRKVPFMVGRTRDLDHLPKQTDHFLPV